MDAQLLTDAAVTLTQAYENPVPNAAISIPQMISGFRVEGPHRVDARRMADRQWFVGEYRSDAAELAAMLAAQDIKPIGIVPRHPWIRLCDVAGLLRIAPDARGRIDIDIAKLREDVGDRLGFPTFAALVPMCLAIGGGLAWWVSTGVMTDAQSPGFIPSLLVGCGLGFIGGGLATCLCLIVTSWLADHIGELRFKKAAKRVDEWSDEKRAEWLREAVKPREIDDYAKAPVNSLGGPVWQKKDAREAVAIRLPDPPADVAKLLLRLDHSGLTPLVAAVPEAISFAVPLSDTLIRNKHAHDAELRTMRSLFDPIIYIEHGSAVAILAQFGDFPIERDVIDIVAAEIRSI